MTNGSLDTEDVRVVLMQDNTKKFVFRDYVFSKLPVRFVCRDNELITLTAEKSELNTLIPIESERVAALCAYCESSDAA